MFHYSILVYRLIVAEENEISSLNVFEFSVTNSEGGCIGLYLIIRTHHCRVIILARWDCIPAGDACDVQP